MVYTHLLDMVGKKFGKLTVSHRVSNNKYGQPMFQCLCDCGKVKITSKSSLTRSDKNTRSCGCLLSESKIRIGDYRTGGVSRKVLETIYPGVSSKLQQKVLSIKKSAKYRNKEFNLSDDQVLWLILKPCNYCLFMDIDNGVGIDRLDSSLGYTWKNSKPCCKNCNYAKNNMTLIEFHNWIKSVYSNTKFYVEQSNNSVTAF